jgi:hypothetical protein
LLDQVGQKVATGEIRVNPKDSSTQPPATTVPTPFVTLTAEGVVTSPTSVPKVTEEVGRADETAHDKGLEVVGRILSNLVFDH